MSDPLREQNALYADFFKHVGLCINVWANIEGDLYGICNSILKAPERYSAIVFYRTPTMDTRLGLVHDLMTAWQEPDGRAPGAHPPPLLKDWLAIKTDLSDLLPFRNQVAHHPVYFGGGKAEVELTEDGMVERYFVEESFITMARAQGDVLRGKAQAKITLSTMADYLTKVEPVRQRLRFFRAEVIQALQ